MILSCFYPVFEQKSVKIQGLKSFLEVVACQSELVEDRAERLAHYTLEGPA